MSDTGYNSLESIMLPESRAMVLDILEERGTPLVYAEAAARMSFDYSAKLKALGTTLEEEVEKGRGSDYEEPQWYASVSFAVSVSGYHKAGIRPTDFHPYVTVRQAIEAKAAGHIVQVVGEVTMTSRDTFEEVIALSPEYALVALASSIASRKLKLLEEWGFKDFDLCPGDERPSYAQLFYTDLLMHRKEGHSAELVTECLRAFPRHLDTAAMRLGVTVEQVRAYLQDEDRTEVKTLFDVWRIMNPGVPDEYLRAMYGEA